MIRDSKSNISVSKGHGYTVEKVKFAVNFVEKAGRNTTIDDWVAAYNYIKNANETAQGCQACKAAKFTAAVRNYARYGYLTLLNEGHSPEEFKDAASKDVERKDEPASEKVEVASETASEPEVVSTVTETADEGEPTVELPQPSKPKVKKKKNVKSDDKQ